MERAMFLVRSPEETEGIFFNVAETLEIRQGYQKIEKATGVNKQLFN